MRISLHFFFALSGWIKNDFFLKDQISLDRLSKVQN